VLFKSVCLVFGVFVVVMIQSHCFKKMSVILFYTGDIHGKWYYKRNQT